MVNTYLDNLFDEQNYKEVLKLTDPYEKKLIKSEELLYYMKAKIALDDFDILDKQEIKKLLFYYFYLLKEVFFDNGYKIIFKDNLKIDFQNFENNIHGLNTFHKYFDLGKNKIFLLGRKGKNPYKEIDNIVDFFIQFTFDCSELYAFKSDEHPLFKWLFKELHSH